MPDVQTFAWLIPVVLAIGGAIGWFGRKLFERWLAKKDRLLLRGEEKWENQLERLLDLHGDMYHKWALLVHDWDPEAPRNAKPLADALRRWLYAQAPHFPEEIGVTLVRLGRVAACLATDRRREVLDAKEALNAAWEGLRKYQREVEGKLGLPGD